MSAEGGQIVFRYPPLPEGVQARDLSGLPNLTDLGVRKGKNALWMAMTGQPGDGWQSRLAEVLNRLVPEGLIPIPAVKPGLHHLGQHHITQQHPGQQQPVQRG